MFWVSCFWFRVSGWREIKVTHNSQLNLLYLGRRHPLKGVEYLERAVKELNHGIHGTHGNVELKIVSTAFGEELERVWEWRDVLVLPTLSENFGLEVAEALERGKRVITTDGAPVWGFLRWLCKEPMEFIVEIHGVVWRIV